MHPATVKHLAILIVYSLAMAGTAQADTFTLPPADVDVVGQIQHITAHRDETLLDLARDFDLGQQEILLANPEVDRWLPKENSVVVLPRRFIIPRAERRGLILNLPEMRLYYFPDPKLTESPVMITHPVSVGRMDWETPLGMTTITSKQKDPSWTPPQSLKEEALADGNILPDVVPAGPDNPLGRYAMRLGLPGYLIHSTNKPYGVGMRVTHGCVRMYPEDIEKLFDQIPVSTPVQIVNQPVKVGWLAGALFLEVHPYMDEDLEKDSDLTQRVLNVIADAIAESGTNRQVALSGRAIRTAIEEQNGIPILISR
ncbi:MAG: L,D-transpeptidase family protein [Gammaproteobacteria bacterium]|nr:L,D-transpeptidase family protein [Gammaproteobacteria bacterium]